jgi:transcriptional regulator with XRE-family HTH domain
MGKNQQLSSFLKKARIRAGMSQKEVSAFLGYSTPQFISNWERGVSTPPGKTLKKLAKLYKVSAEQLYEALLAETLARVEKGLRKRFFG